MIVYPAIDIRGGKCVRLTEGRFDRETVYADDPVAVAKTWQEQGAAWLHVVDLDGARAGFPVNREIIGRICRAVAIPVQAGGGIRTAADIETLLTAGVSRVILGSAAVRQPDLVADACAKWGERIAVGIDAKGGRVAVDGWERESDLAAEELARRMTAAGVARIVYTDISRDGTLSGVNAANAAAFARKAGVDVIVAGGVAGVADIVSLKEAAGADGAGIEGVIIGKALYSGLLTLAEAIRAAEGEKINAY